MNELKLTVGNVISRDLFNSAQVIAGAGGLDRHVKWSHILEITEFESLINGGELILTTGAVFELSISTQIQYMKLLIENGAAAICIEVGKNFADISPEIVAIANENDFPVIIFKEIVKFVDITQDLHTFIINQHHEMLSQLDGLSRKFGALSLTHNGILKILQELHQYFQSNTFFINDDPKPYYYPLEGKELDLLIREKIESTPSENLEQGVFVIGEDSFALMPVRGLGQIWGYLCMHVTEPVSEDFIFIILDRASLAIMQILLRNRTIDERQQNMEGKFVRKLLNGQGYEPNDIKNYFPTPSRNMHYRIFIIQLDFIETDFMDEEWDEVKLQRSMLIRSLFKRNGFFPAISIKKNEIAVVASFIATEDLKRETERFSQVTKDIIKIKDNSFIEGSKSLFGISTVYKEPKDIKKGYEEANTVLQMHDAIALNSNFYEEIGVYKILQPLLNAGYLERLVIDYLAPLIDYDEKMQSNLLETLTVYLEQMGSKKETAERLFIVRQTLYHRIEKIEQLLGADFMNPQNRIALEIAIKAYEFLQGMKVNDKS